MCPSTDGCFRHIVDRSVLQGSGLVAGGKPLVSVAGVGANGSTPQKGSSAWVTQRRLSMEASKTPTPEKVAGEQEPGAAVQVCQVPE